MSQNPRKNIKRKKRANRRMYSRLSEKISNFVIREGEHQKDDYDKSKRMKSQLENLKVASSY
jgi:hypothetical protein